MRTWATTGDMASQRVMVFGFDFRHDLLDEISRSCQVVHAKDTDDALRILAHDGVEVLILGPAAALRNVLEILDRSTDLQGALPETIIVCATPDLQPFQRFVDDGRIYYLSHGETSPEHLGALVASVARQSLLRKPDLDIAKAGPDKVAPLSDLVIRLTMQTDIVSVAALLEEVVGEQVHDGQVRCLLFDASEDTLKFPTASGDVKCSFSAAAGLAGFVARTGTGVLLDQANLDARYEYDVDNPQRISNPQFLASQLLGSREYPLALLLWFEVAWSCHSRKMMCNL